MAASRWIGCISALSLLVSLGAASAADGAWSQRVQILYDPDLRTVSRALLRVWDEAPALGLEFLWEPETAFDPSATGGLVEGRGKLVWRVRGSAAHDRSAIYSTYVGDMKNGRPSGTGRLERRDGQILEGEWTAGQLEGRGMHLDADGNRYEGEFRAGVAHGKGRQAMANGSIFDGAFRNGRRHGEGRLRLPGGMAYNSGWRDGLEIAGQRPDLLADATIGGLLRAQAGGGDAGKIDLSVVVDQRMTQQSDLRYTHVVNDDEIVVYPSNPGIVEGWRGEATINSSSYLELINLLDWEEAPAFLQVSFETNDGSRVRVDGLELQVQDSQVYRKPFLSTIGNWGCVGYRPSFSFQNNGWGGVQDAKLSFAFFDIDEPQRSSAGYELDIGSFDDGLDVSLEDALDLAGVDTRTLATSRFQCPSQDQMAQCRQTVIETVEFGEVGDLLSEGPVLQLGVRGEIAYKWSDDDGQVHDQVEPFEDSIHVAVIETDQMVAEGGDGWGGSPGAPRYQTINLPTGQKDYAVDLPIRGNRNLAAYVARMKIYAEQSSIHRFHAAARFADGSVRRSKPVSLFYIRPKEYFHEPQEPETGCTIDPGTMPYREE